MSGMFDHPQEYYPGFHRGMVMTLIKDKNFEGIQVWILVGSSIAFEEVFLERIHREEKMTLKLNRDSKEFWFEDEESRYIIPGLKIEGDVVTGYTPIKGIPFRKQFDTEGKSIAVFDGHPLRH